MNNLSAQSVSQRLSEQLAQVIAGTVPGHRLPSEPELAIQLGVSRATLREAMRAFETQGLIRRKQGSGTYVSQPIQTLESGIEVLESIETMATRSGLTTTMGNLSINQRPSTPDEQLFLNLEPFSDVIQITRVILANDRPVAYLVDNLPTWIMSLDKVIEEFSGSILDILIKRTEPGQLVSRTEINAVTAIPLVARALGIQRGDVLLHFSAILFDYTGKAVDHSQSYFLPGYFRFHVVRKTN